MSIRDSKKGMWSSLCKGIAKPDPALHLETGDKRKTKQQRSNRCREGRARRAQLDPQHDPPPHTTPTRGRQLNPEHNGRPTRSTYHTHHTPQRGRSHFPTKMQLGYRILEGDG